MKNLALCFLVFLSVPAFAENTRDIHSPGRFGLGLGSGTISNGISGKYYASSTLAFQGVLGSVGGRGIGNRYRNNGGLGAGLDFLLEFGPLWQHEVLRIDWSVGAGAGVGVRNSVTGVAVAGVLGLEFNFRPVPIDFVIEFRPVVAVSPDTDFGPDDFTAHLRIYFK